MTSEDFKLEIITHWDGSWVELLNDNVKPLLKDIGFENHLETFNIDGQILTGQDLVKVVVDTSSKDFFLNTLSEGELDKDLMMRRLEGFIYREFGYQLNLEITHKNAFSEVK